MFVGFLKTFSVKMKIGNNQKMKTINFSFSMFSVENRKLISGKMKLWGQCIILSKSKNAKRQEVNIS